jgi:hypothetical protein
MAARASNGKHSSLLEQAMAQLIQNQAQLVALQIHLAAQQTQFAAQHVELEKERMRAQKVLDERFERIETLLLRHDKMLKDLPEAVRKKIGYQEK